MDSFLRRRPFFFIVALWGDSLIPRRNESIFQEVFSV